ncbi:MAG: hypothetical protein ACK5KR_00775 [Breznakia sp.]
MKQYFEKKQKKKSLKKKKKELKSTLEWMDIDSVHSHHIRLKGKKNNMVIGVKLDPYSIFLNSPQEQSRRINIFRLALNRLHFDLYHGYVFNPVNLDSYMSMLAGQQHRESDAAIMEMIDDDVEKAKAFIRDFRELEFFIMIKGTAGSKLDDQFHLLQTSLTNAKFTFKQLNRIDFENYIAYAFENPLANDFYFSRGIFGEEMEEMEVNTYADE